MKPTTETLLRGQELFGPSIGQGMIYIVRSGCIRLYKVLPDGRSINLGLLGPNTIFTQEDTSDGIASGAIAEALVDSTVSVVEGNSLATLIAESPELAVAIVTGMSRRMTELQTLVEHLLVRDTAVRLATTLIGLAQRFGRPTADGLTVLPSTPSELDRLRAKLELLIDKAAALPLDQIVGDFRGVIQAAERLVDSPETREAMASVTRTLLALEQTASRLDDRIQPLIDRVQGLTDEAATTLRTARVEIGTVAGSVGPRSKLQGDLTDTLDQVQLLLRAVRGLLDDLNRYPGFIVLGRSNQAGR